MRNSRNKKILPAIGTICMLFLLLSACKNSSAVTVNTETEITAAEVRQYTDAGIAMGTVISETIYSEGEDVTEEVLSKLTELENNILSWRVESSEISLLNAEAGTGKKVLLSGETDTYIKQALQLAQDSSGAFDPTIGKITRLWDIDGENPRVPEAEEIGSLLVEMGYEKIEYSEEGVLLPENVSIDLGAIGKGIGCDVIRNYLSEKTEISGAVISVGGSIVTYGSKPGGEPWQVAITDPRDDTGEYFAVLTLAGENYISTSGDYEKYIEQDGQRYHHILDPETGYPADSGLISVTIVCDSGINSDGLSTACFVLGLNDSLTLLEKYGAEAVFVDTEKNVYVTDGLKDKLSIIEDEYVAAE